MIFRVYFDFNVATFRKKYRVENSQFICKANWGEWPSGLRRCSKNWKVPSSIPTTRSAGIRDPTSLQGLRWPADRKFKTQSLTLAEWDCLLNNGPKLAVGQPNRSCKVNWLTSFYMMRVSSLECIPDQTIVLLLLKIDIN